MIRQQQRLRRPNNGRHRLLPRQRAHHRWIHGSIIQVIHCIVDVELTSNPVRLQDDIANSSKKSRARLFHCRRVRHLLLRSTTVFNLDGTITMARYLWSEPMASIQARTDGKTASSIFFLSPSGCRFLRSNLLRCRCRQALGLDDPGHPSQPRRWPELASPMSMSSARHPLTTAHCLHRHR
ncbi:hypothetical protein ACLOJK_007952 [Asimina triloba]